MMLIRSSLWRLTCLGAACLVACLTAPDAWAITVLSADADTGTEESQPDDIEGNKDRIQVRSETGSGRQNVGYIRFDLAGVDVSPFSSAVFNITRRNATGWNTGQIQVYGLNDVAGNTPQNWVEFAGDDGSGNPTSGLNYNNSGAEIPGDGDQLTQDLGTIGTSGTENLWALGDLPGIPTGGDLLPSTDFSTPALLDFLNSRSGGLATLLLVGAEGTNRELLFAPNEFGGGAGFGPKLTLVPEPTSLALALLSMAGLGLATRRRR